MSRTDEITKILKSHVRPISDHNRDIVAIWQKSIPTITTEIEKLFEGKVEYFMEFKDTVGWHVKSPPMLELETVQNLIKKQRKNHPVNEWHIIKRTTTKIIEE